LFLLVFFQATAPAPAANLDEETCVWGENVGYIDLKPGGDAGPGIMVSGSLVIGYLWGENIGWINLAGTGDGLMLDPDGSLTGFGWGENVGWINFAPSGGGVSMDTVTGELSGWAWGENIGWINFGTQEDLCPNDPDKTAPGVCGCGVPDTDTDGDGAADCIDGCPNDPDKIDPGHCGCGISDADTDGDTVPDCDDECPFDSAKSVPGVCGCGSPDTDTDADDTPDCIDGCPNDPNKVDPGICGCGIPDTDVNNNGIIDCNESPGGTDPADDVDLPNHAEVQPVGMEDSLFFESLSGTSMNCEATENPSPADAPPAADFPYGMFGFTIEGITPGASTTMTVTLPEGSAPDTYYKYGPTPADPADHWYEFLYDGSTGAEINGNVITLYFVDGLRGDGDLDAGNGIILDPGGPAVISSSSEPGFSGDGGCFVKTLP